MSRLEFSISLEPGFDERTAYWLARLSRVAYRDYPGIVRETKVFWNDPVVYAFENRSSETQACILEYDDVALVGFRGTEPNQLKDWLTDFRFFKSKYRGHSIHGGFLGSLESLVNVPRESRGYRDRQAIDGGEIEAETFAEKIAGYANQKPVLLTGHSLGGALASLAGLYFKEEYGLEALGIYTFGQPKIGGRAFVKRYLEVACPNIFPHVNDEDVVPKVPPRALRFVHFPITHPFDSQGKLIVDPETRRAFQRRVDRGLSAVPKLLEGIGDHSMLAYTEHWERKLLGY
jgi:triacylglycerol lipase